MIKYRPEIDGLRSIAVIAVVLYHADLLIDGINPFIFKQYEFVLFEGGFIGVDIFFVISGYLICSIILKGIQENNFRFSEFYERRARRILPVLFFITFISILLGILVMDSNELVEFSGSILSSLGFGSNIWFWLEDSYTAQSSELKPFLHTWSLSIEEQFYFIFPPLIILIWKYAKKYLLSFLIILFFISLQIADFTSTRFTDAGFYLIHTRAWELIAGAILAKLELDYGRTENSFLNFLMPPVGIFLVLHSILFFDDKMYHPSFITVLPIFGTMLLIWFCRKGEFISDILSSKLFVSVGLISYGLYLWHFPLFAFSKILLIEQTFTLKFVLILMSFVLAISTFYIIEKPTRNRKIINSKSIVSSLLISFTFLLVISGSTYLYSNHQMKNLTIGKMSYDVEFEKDKRFSYLHDICPKIGWSDCRKVQNDKINILVVGDSMSIDAVNIVSPNFPEYHYVVDDEFGGCPPHPNIRRLVQSNHPNLVECINKNTDRFSSDYLNNIDVIIIKLLYNWFEPKDLMPYLKFLQENKFENVIIFGNYISLKDDFYNYISKNQNISYQSSDEVLNDFVDKKFFLQHDLANIARDFNYSFINLRENICDKNCPLFIDKYPFTWDKFHFSLEFSRHLSVVLRDELITIFTKFNL